MRAVRAVALVVIIVIDQFGATYLRRWGDLTTEGIGRLARRGVLYHRGTYQYANTETSAGHATIATGAWPNVHGLVANVWYDQSGRLVNCVEDKEYGRSPAQLMAPGIGDAIKLATRGKGRTFSFGTKDRAAITLGGTLPDLVSWYDKVQGRMIAGSWKGLAKPPDWWQQLALEHAAANAFGTKWDRFRARLDYTAAAGPDDLITEADLDGFGRVFPHPLGRGIPAATDERWRSMWPAAPASIDAVFGLAIKAVEKEELGRRGTVDYLAVSIGTLDVAGHYYGSHSQEALDILLRIDAAIGRLIDAVEKRVGIGGAIFVVTGDHGVMPTPEETPGVRMTRISPDPIVAAILDTLKREFPKDEISAVVLNAPRIYLGPSRPGADRLKISRRVAEVVRTFPGIIDAIAFEDLGQWPEPMRSYFQRSSFAGRNAEVLLLHEANGIIDTTEIRYQHQGTSHGSPYGYDTTVPIIIDGPGVRGGADERPYRMTQIAPTIAALLEIEPPAAAMDEPLPAVR